MLLEYKSRNNKKKLQVGNADITININNELCQEAETTKRNYKGALAAVGAGYVLLTKAATETTKRNYK